MTHKHTLYHWNWQDSGKADVRTAHLRANTPRSPPSAFARVRTCCRGRKTDARVSSRDFSPSTLLEHQTKGGCCAASLQRLTRDSESFVFFPFQMFSLVARGEVLALDLAFRRQQYKRDLAGVANEREEVVSAQLCC